MRAPRRAGLRRVTSRAHLHTVDGAHLHINGRVAMFSSGGKKRGHLGVGRQIGAERHPQNERRKQKANPG